MTFLKRTADLVENLRKLEVIHKNDKIQYYQKDQSCIIVTFSIYFSYRNRKLERFLMDAETIMNAFFEEYSGCGCSKIEAEKGAIINNEEMTIKIEISR